MTREEFRENICLMDESELYAAAKAIYRDYRSGIPDSRRKLEMLKSECEARGVGSFDFGIADSAEELILRRRKKKYRLNFLSRSDLLELMRKSDNLAFSGDKVVFTVDGNSMTGAGIHHGDQLLADTAAFPESGDIIVALINGLVFVKRFVKEGGDIWFVSENPEFPPVLLEPDMDLRVIGKVIKIMKDRK